MTEALEMAEKWKAERAGRVPTKFIIDKILPAGQVHLLAGPSGSGKTTIAFQLYNTLTQGLPFFGFRTHPVRWAYISTDRASESVYDTQDRVGVAFPAFSLVDHDLIGASLTDTIIPRLTKIYGYRPNFIYIDGFTALVPAGGMNNYQTVAIWLASLQRYCAKMGITIMGGVHTAKVKEGATIPDPRQKVAGSVAWAGFSETVFLIEPDASSKDKSKRVFLMLPRNGAEEKLILHFDDEGKLVMSAAESDKEEAAMFVLSMLIPDVENAIPGKAFLYSALWDKAEKKGINRRTLDRWLHKLVEGGKLVKSGKGVYEIPGAEEEVVIDATHNDGGAGEGNS